MKNARQAEIIKAVQKDSVYTNNLTEDISDLLKYGTKPKIWIRYNHFCKFLAELSYFGFLSINRLQTLGEEYTGIIQVDSNFSLPKKTIQLLAIILEYGGESLYLKVLHKFEKDIKCNKELKSEAQDILLKFITFMKFSLPYIKGFHKALFYLNANQYQISKRFLGIKYVLIRKWLNSNQNLNGFKILGFLTFSQLIISLILNILEFRKQEKESVIKVENREQKIIDTTTQQTRKNVCNLCLEQMDVTSLTICGHLFCWKCIIPWIGEKGECPVCREFVKKSNVIQLMNF